MATIRLSTAAPLRGAKRWRFLEHAHTIRIASQSGSDNIYVSPMWFVVRERVIYVPIDQGSKHAANVESTAGRLSACVDEGEEFSVVRGVSIEGGAERVTDEGLVDELHKMVLDKYFYLGHPHRQDYNDYRQYYGVQFYQLTVTKMFGWDMRELYAMPVLERRSLPEVMV